MEYDFALYKFRNVTQSEFVAGFIKVYEGHKRWYAKIYRISNTMNT